jgi:signal transduction histidine kinase
MIKNKIPKVLLKVNDLDSYKRVINYLLTFLIIISLFLSFTALFVTYFRYENNAVKVNHQLLTNANSILQSNISEKLSILLNNKDFVSFINQGEYSRNLNKLHMRLLFKEFVDNDFILGFSVRNQNNESILSISTTNSPFYVTLDLCYLNGQINNKFGHCNFKFTVYMSEYVYIKLLSKMYSNIKFCKKNNQQCDKFNPFITSEFGSFSINSYANNLIAIEHMPSNIFQLLIPAIIIIFILTVGLFITQRIIKLLTNRYLANPIKEIEVHLKNNIPLQNKYIKEINYLSQVIEEYQSHKLEIELGKNLAQVAHDMRSPLLAVDSFFRLVENKLDENEQIFGRRAIRRLDDIAWSLLSKYKNKNISEDEKNYVFLYSCIQEILSEKRMEYAKKNIEFEFKVSANDVFTLAYLNSLNLKRMLSNIANNAANAISHIGIVEISLEVNIGGFLISIKDNGKGMSDLFLQEILLNVKNSKRKTNLGLPHAIKFIHQEDGQFDIKSIEGCGTTVNISLPSCEAPVWLLEEYQIQLNELLVIIDDSKWGIDPIRVKIYG